MKLYTCEEVANIFSVKKVTIWDWIKSRKLKAYKAGKMYRISEEQIEEFLKSSRN